MCAATQPQLHHIMEKYTSTETIKFPYSLFPPFRIPPSAKSEPEWHLIMRWSHQWHKPVQPALLWYDSSFRDWSSWWFRKTGVSLSDNSQALCWQKRPMKLRRRGARRSLPCILHVLFCWKMLYTNHVVNNLGAEVALIQKNWGASNIQLWNLDPRRPAKESIKPAITSESNPAKLDLLTVHSTH